MQTKIFGLAALLAVSTVFWAGCSSSDDTTNDATPDSGANKAETGAGDDDDDDTDEDGGTDGGKPSGDTVSVPYDTTGNSCKTVEACGGDPKGTWKYADGTCLQLIELAKELCPTAVVSDITISGTLEIGAAAKRGSKMTAKAKLPRSCIDKMVTQEGVTCDFIAIGLQAPYNPNPAQGQISGLGVDSATTCTGGTGDCNCNLVLSDVKNQSYTLQNDGKQLKFDDGKTFDFCVEGDKLSYIDTTANNPMPFSYVTKKQ